MWWLVDTVRGSPTIAHRHDRRPLSGRLAMTTPDSLMTDNGSGDLQYCAGLPIPLGDAQCHDFTATVKSNATLGTGTFNLDDPGKEAPNEAFWICLDLMALLTRISVQQHEAILAKLRDTNDQLDKLNRIGAVGRFLRKLVGRPVNTFGLTMVMNEFGDEHARVHDLYDQVNEALQDVALHLIMMVDGSFSEEQYQRCKETHRIDRLLRRR